jgi:prepilin-type N-terminal cleavage/methylation domain-containing protein
MRRGFTLFEILLVLALLVAIAAMVMPAISNSLSHARLSSGGEMVRAAWGKARLAAMNAGEAYVFRFEHGGSRYQIVQLAALSAEGGEDLNVLPSLSEEDEEYAEADMLRLSKSRLPTEVVFMQGRVAAVPQTAGAAVTGPAMAAEGGWSQPIMFYPDGTTSDAAVLVANADRETVRVTLRGLTGTSRASDVGHEEEL